jgi:carbonic anhydrase/acetyltransferase-like protein (isoleucine patch superfamily)
MRRRRGDCAGRTSSGWWATSTGKSFTSRRPPLSAPRARPPLMSAALIPASSRDLGEIRNRQRRRTDLRQQRQAVGAQHRIGGVDDHLVEEGIHGRAQLGQRAHGAGEILHVDGGRTVPLHLLDGLIQGHLRGLAQVPGIGSTSPAPAVYFLLVAQDVARAFDAGQQNGAVVGSDGFGFAKQADGTWYKIPQTGIAVIGDDVEIQANSTLDRATMGETHIGNGAKIDNLVHVAHAVKVGENTLLCAQVGIAGSAKVGNNCVLTGQVGVVGHLTIGDGAVITPQSGVPNDVPAGALYSGSPVIEHKNWLKSIAVFSRLPELQKQVRELTAEVARLRSRT